MADIKYINGKYYDFTPPRPDGTGGNASFLLTAKELQVLGVKNYYFMLRIDNPRIADIDPFKKNITKQEIDLLMKEAHDNMWYFARKCVRLRTDAGIVPFGLHRGLAASMWCFERHYDNCLCEPRQTWKTTGTIAGPLQWAFQLSRNLKMHFFGKETENTKRNLASLKDDIALLPEWMQFRRYIGEDGKVKKSRQATEILENNLLKNKLFIHPKPTSLQHADGMARGDSGAILYFDEIEHTPFFPTLMASSAPVFKTASENAAKVGAPYARLMSCTPGNLDTKVGKESLPIIKSMIPWTEKIYDFTPEEIAEYKKYQGDIYYNSEDRDQNRDMVDIFYIEYHYYQVRKDYNWVLAQFKISGDRMEVRREILLERLRGSTESAIDQNDLDYLISNIQHPYNDLVIDHKWRFLLYDHGQGYQMGQLLPFDKQIPYLAGIDPSAGGGGDNFAITIVNPYNLKIAAEFKNKYITGPMAVRLLIELVREYIPKAVLIPEKNSMGHYLIQMICEQTSIKDNLYWSQKARELEDMVEEDSEDYELKMQAIKHKKYGTYTNKKVRDAMFELLFLHLNSCRDLLTTENLVDDLCKLIRTSTGRIEAMEGEHDDCVMSYLHCLYIYYNGDNLENFGIYKSEHPIIGKIETDLEEHLEEDNPISGFFSTENVQMSFDDYAMQDAAMLEDQIKMLVNTFDFIEDDVYKKEDNQYGNSYDDTVELPATFFDAMNGFI